MNRRRTSIAATFVEGFLAEHRREPIIPANRSRWTVSGCLVALAITASLPAVAQGSSHEFPKPDALRPAVAFWTKIFAVYSEHQVVLHDAWYLGKVYDVLDFRYLAPDGETVPLEYESQKRSEVNDAKDRLRRTLLRLHEAGPNPAGLSADEQKIYDLFGDVPDPDKFLTAADRVHSQSGLREKFGAGIALEERYIGRMERIFREAGLPTELTRLPLVESCFNVHAYSKVGAAGVWQFMPATARQYLRVDSRIDERRDPIRSTYAAAEHLRRDYDALGSWPLAITAYNHGREGVARGADQIGADDIGAIVMRYHGPAFGFASRNFYAEFLAALDVVERKGELFRDLHLDAPLDSSDFEDIRPSRGWTVHMAKGKSTRGIVLASARSDRPSSGRPASAGAAPKRSVQTVLHHVRPGQTLVDIARRYGTTVALLQGANNLRHPKGLQAGKKLKIPQKT